MAAPSGAGKTAALQEVSKRTGYSRINVNLELSRRLLNLTQRQRSLQTGLLLSEIASHEPGEVVLLDNVEILFDVNLNQDPLRCFQALSRNRTIVVAWNGTLSREGGQQPILVYAAPGHPEYRQDPAAELTLITPPPVTA